MHVRLRFQFLDFCFGPGVFAFYFKMADSHGSLKIPKVNLVYTNMHITVTALSIKPPPPPPIVLLSAFLEKQETRQTPVKKTTIKTMSCSFIQSAFYTLLTG